MPYPSLLRPCPCVSPLLTCTSTGDSQTQFCLSLCGVSGSWCTQGLFEPFKHLWQEWGLILNANSPPLQSCWGFSFALGVGYLLKFGPVPHSRRSRAYHLVAASPLPLDVGCFLSAAPVMCSLCSSACMGLLWHWWTQSWAARRWSGWEEIPHVQGERLLSHKILPGDQEKKPKRIWSCFKLFLLGPMLVVMAKENKLKNFTLTFYTILIIKHHRNQTDHSFLCQITLPSAYFQGLGIGKQ